MAADRAFRLSVEVPPALGLEDDPGEHKPPSS
jgi:hypothetical protein